MSMFRVTCFVFLTNYTKFVLCFKALDFTYLIKTRKSILNHSYRLRFSKLVQVFFSIFPLLF